MRSLFNLAIAFVIAYGVIAALLVVFQEKLVYFPGVGREMTATPRVAGIDFEDVELRTADGVRLHGWWAAAPQSKGAVLVFHGNAGNVSHRIGYLSMFVNMRYSVLMIDYRGFGRSDGFPSEQGTYHDATAAWKYVTADRGIDPRRIIFFGESLGGGVATWLATQHRPSALVLASTFTSVPDLGADIYWWLPVHGLARIRYDNLERISRIEAPVFIAHSRDDESIAYRHGERLFAAARQPKAMLTLAGGHNDGFLYGRESWAASLREFLVRHVPQ